MFIKMSSSHAAPLEAPFPQIGLRCEVILLETVRDLDETLAVSTKRHLQDLVSIDIPPSRTNILLRTIEPILQNPSHLLTS